MRSAAVVLSSFAFLLLAACGENRQAQQPPAPPPPTVTVAKPVKKTVTERDEHVGRFVAAESVEIRARVSGYLDEIHFRDGQTVEKGQLLFTVDRRTYQTAFEQTKADLNRAKARLENAAAELQRSEKLMGTGNISDQLYDQRVAAKRDAEAQLQSAEAALRRSQLDLDFTELRSPVSGRIGDRRVSVGNLVTGGTAGNTTLLANIVSMDPIFFEFTVDEGSYLRFMRMTGGDKRGMPVEMKLLEEADYNARGTIDFVDNVIDQSSGTIRIRATFQNPRGLFTPGMFGKVRLNTSAPYEALLVPDAAVMSDQSRKVLMTVTADDTVVPRPVQLGPIYDGLRVIRSGVGPEDTVIVNGLLRARPGAKVTPRPAGQPGQGAPGGAPGGPAAGAPPAGGAAAAPAAAQK